MIKTRKDLKIVLKADLSRYNGRRPNIKDWILKNESWYIYNYIRHLRYIEYHINKRGIHKIAYLYHFYKYKRLGFTLKMAIYPGTIGPGFRIYHSGGYVQIDPHVRIGENCTMLSGVVFGNKSEKIDDRTVVVGNNCYFGIDSKIIGSVTIGNNVIVGANSVVTKDIPDNAIVAGVPARVIRIIKKS